MIRPACTDPEEAPSSGRTQGVPPRGKILTPFLALFQFRRKNDCLDARVRRAVSRVSRLELIASGDTMSTLKFARVQCRVKNTPWTASNRRTARTCKSIEVTGSVYMTIHVQGDRIHGNVNEA